MRYYFNKRPYLFVLIAINVLIRACEPSEPLPAERRDIALGGSRLAELLGAGDDTGYAQVTRARTFEFPADHGPHTDYRNEWWYVTGNLDGPDKERVGFELTFFRFSLTPENRSEVDSAWQTNQVYMAHFALTDVDQGDFHFTERFGRGALGIAGAQADPFRVWLDDWSIAAIDGGGDGVHWRLTATDPEFSLDLDLVAMKEPTLNGDNGLSQKSGEPGNASYYYSMTRLESTGMVRIGKQSIPVSGLAWLDREWGSSALSSEQRGWDWFALQLSDGSELMFYNIRRNDGSADEHSAGTWTDPDGVVTSLTNEDVTIAVGATWESGKGGTYPAAWTIDVPILEMTLDIQPVLDDQELSTNVRYWEGAVDVVGTAKTKAISGRGYVELTGYAE